VISKEHLASSEVVISSLLFRSVFGDGASVRTLSAFVVLSNLGNVLAVRFAYARLNQ